MMGRDQLLSVGVSPDANLAKELRSPGADQRHGVNIVARPPEEVIIYIGRIQAHLCASEPDQYYYPRGDLHLTIIEMCSSRSPAEAEDVASAVTIMLPDLVSGIRAPHMVKPFLIYDSHACALNFIAVDGALETLRRTIAARLLEKGITPRQRYSAMAAHITLMRYIAPLRTPIDIWLNVLAGAPQADGLAWSIDRLWMTCGATWYGMHRRIRTMGPYEVPA